MITSDRQVLIVEDDPGVASIHRRTVNTHPGFVVGAVVPTGEEAVGLLQRGMPVDLILLDLAPSGPGGSEMLRALRSEGGPDVIVLTAARDPRLVQEALHFGVVDYLVKPFPVERLRQALAHFRDRMNVLRAPSLEQADIDALFASTSASPMLPKGVRAQTLKTVRQVLQHSGGIQLTAEEVADRAAIARVTARRYLEYLTTLREIDVEAVGNGPGRPRKRYGRAYAER